LSGGGLAVPGFDFLPRFALVSLIRRQSIDPERF
jgi:hypothetical protein